MQIATGGQMAQTQRGGRHGPEGHLGHRRKNCSLFCEGFLDSGRTELSSLGMRNRAVAIFLPCRSAQTDFRKQHNVNSGGLSHLHQAPTLALYRCFFTRTSVPESQSNSRHASPGRPAQIPKCTKSIDHRYCKASALQETESSLF